MRPFICAIACVLAVWAPSQAATLDKAHALAIVTAKSVSDSGGFSSKRYPLVLNSLSVKAAWAMAFANCHNFPDATTNATLHFTGGKWHYACGHGDDVMYVESAVKRCGMTRAQAPSLGFPPILK